MSKKQYNKSSEFVQLSLWDIPQAALEVATQSPDSEPLPLPLRTANKWHFPLAYIVNNGRTYYRCLDWFEGLGGEKTGWSKAKKELLNSNQQLNSTDGLQIVVIPYIANNGRTYDTDFTDDTGLYIIAQEMRSMKKRPQLDEIKQYLAESGAFVDLIMTNAMAADSLVNVLEERHNLARQQGKEKRNFFTDIAYHSNVNRAPKYGVLTNIEYKNIFRLKAEQTATNELIDVLKLDKKQAKHLRDNLNTMALSAVDAAETTAAIKMQQIGRLLTDDEQSEIVRQCARKVSPLFWELAEYAGINLLTGKPLLPKWTVDKNFD